TDLPGSSRRRLSRPRSRASTGTGMPGLAPAAPVAPGRESAPPRRGARRRPSRGRRRGGRRRGAARALGGAVVGPARFFLLGLALPLERPAHEPAELRRAAGVLAIRFAVAPLTLYGLGRAFGAEIPSAFLIGAAMPSAFHLLILARVFELRPHLMRLLVLGSTVPAVAAVLAATAVLR
ncbi:MAG: AEC family transporter, partial [Gaiellaceae bacterium]